MEQLAAWEREYRSGHAIPTTTRTRPSSAVLKFDAFLQRQGLVRRSILDLGAGAGRNSIYFAERGHRVTLLDFAQSALEIFEGKSSNVAWRNSARVVRHDLTEPLPFADNTFDAVIDVTTTTSLVPGTMQGLVGELQRVIKPGGHVLSYIHNRSDGYLQLVSPNQDHYEVDDTGIIDYAYSEQELRQLYKAWQILDLQQVEKEDVLCDERHTRRLWWMVCRNEKKRSR
jgi:SAM-dependent methyltransferase